MFETVLRGGARAIHVTANERERDEINRLLALLEVYPYEESAYTSKVLVSPLIMNVYDDGTWCITYRIVHPFIEVYSIQPSDRVE